MTEWKWKGSRWWKFDLHTHTPASDDYGKGASQTTLSNCQEITVAGTIYCGTAL